MKPTGLLLLVSVLACGTPTQSTPSVPVASTPLTGTVGGVGWTAKTATASSTHAFSDGGEKWVDVSSGTLTCSGFNDAEIIGTIPWSGQPYDLSLKHNLTFVLTERDGGITNGIALNGRVELYDITDAGARLRIRAIYDANNQVEGEVAVKVCD